MSIILDDLRDMAQSGVPLCDLAADEIESLEQAYELLFNENAKLRQQADQQSQPVNYVDGADRVWPNFPEQLDRIAETLVPPEQGHTSRSVKVQFAANHIRWLYSQIASPPAPPQGMELVPVESDVCTVCGGSGKISEACDQGHYGVTIDCPRCQRAAASKENKNV